jgi:SAM-dependent methyltransferase
MSVPPSDDYVLNEPAFSIIRAQIARGTRVLDVGCGFGNVGRFLRAAGIDVDGVEPDPARADVARTALHRVWKCRIEDAAAEPDLGRYGVVTVLDVIEHVVSPVEALACMRDLLEPGGRLFLFLPNSAYWSFRLKVLRGDWSYHDWGLFDRTHLRFFDLHTASKLCHDAGFSEVRRWYTTPGKGTLARLGRRFLPTVFALHVLFELQPDGSRAANASEVDR